MMVINMYESSNGGKNISLGKMFIDFTSCEIIKKRGKTYKQGYIWRANPSTKNGQIELSSVNLQKCIKKVEEFINSEENTLGYISYQIIGGGVK